MQAYVLERSQIISLSKSETFSFFSNAFNLEKITPSFLGFKVLTPPPIEMATGTLIEYRLSLFGIPMRWLTKIERWDVEKLFIDTQLAGPYALWRHTHTFEELDSKRTLMKDTVEYRLPFGILGRLTHELVVKHILKRIFDYRAKMTALLLESRSA